MTGRWRLVVCVALVAVGPSTVRAGPVVHVPADRSLVSGDGILHVIGEVQGAGAPGMEVRLDGDIIVAVARRVGDRAVMHAALRLAPGLNRLSIVFRGSSGRPITMEREVFHVVPLVPDAVPPPEFARRPFHAGDAPVVCARCHRVVARAEDTAPAAPEQSTCFSCHAGLTRAAEVHGPTAQWACTRCHDAAAGAAYATPEPVMPLCYACHVEQKERFYGSRYQHGPTATGRCTICHSPHGTGHRVFLKKAPWDLCTTCHVEKKSGRHVVAWGPSGQSHPTRGRPDPARPGQELSCASCHNPHAAPSPKLWNFKATIWLDLCRNCHARLIGT